MSYQSLRYAFVLIICFVFLSNCLTKGTHGSSGKAHNKHKVLGGWQKLDSVDPSKYTDFLQFLQNQNAIVAPFDLLRVEKQVVNGWNYKFTFKQENEYRRVLVFKNRDETLELKSNEVFSTPNQL